MNVNVSYNGFTLADAASCVMMRLPVPDLVWDMDTLWKAWNGEEPAVMPESTPEPAIREEEAVPVNQEAAKCVIRELEERIRKPASSRAKPVAYAGKEYPSVRALAETYGLSEHLCRVRLQRGIPLEKSLGHGKRITVNGTEYASMNEAAKALGISYSALFIRIKKGLPLDAAKGEIQSAPPSRAKPVSYGGKDYPSIKALAKAYGLNEHTCAARLKHNIPLDAEPDHGNKPITIAGKDYPNLKTAAEALGISYGALWARMKKGLPLDMEYGTRPHGTKPRAMKPKTAKPAASKPAPKPKPEPDAVEPVRQVPAALPPKSNRYADEGNGRRLKNCPCELDGRQYTSLDTMAVILDITDGEAYRQVMERGKFLKGRVKE